MDTPLEILTSEENKLNRARTIWKLLVQDPTLYSQSSYCLWTPIRGTSCNIPMCIYGWLRQLFPEDYEQALKECGISFSENQLTKYFLRGSSAMDYQTEGPLIRSVSDMLLPSAVAALITTRTTELEMMITLHGLCPEVDIRGTSFESKLAFFVGHDNFEEISEVLSKDQLDNLTGIHKKLSNVIISPTPED